MRILLVFFFMFVSCSCSFAGNEDGSIKNFMVNEITSSLILNHKVLVEIREENYSNAAELLEIEIDLYVNRLWSVYEDIDEKQRKSILKYLMKIKEYRNKYPRTDFTNEKDSLSSYYKTAREKASEILSNLD